MNTILSTAIMQRCGLQLRPNNYFFWTVFARRGVQSHARTRQHTPKSIYAYENSYIQISITKIASYAQKLSSQ